MKKIYYLIAMAFVALTFTSCEDVPSPYGQPINPNATATVDPAGSGTADDPFNIAGAIAKCKEIGDVVSSEKYYVKGYAATAATADASYGNVSFYLTDSQDGKGKRFYAYQVAGSDGQKLAAGYTINVGDEVVIYGPMYNYNGSTPETASKGAAYIVTVNGEKTNGGSSSGGETVDPTGEGTAAAPYNVAGIIAATKDLASGSTTSNEIYATGYVTGTPKFNDKYSSMSYYICDDAEGKTQSFYVYSGNGLDNKTFSSADDLKAGDKVTVCGKVTNYNGTIEFQSKNYLVMLNDQTGSGGGGDTPTPSSGNMTKAVSGTVVTFTSSSITGSDEVTVDFNAQGWADKAAATTVTLANGTKIEFAGGENTSNAPTFYSATKGIRVYAKNTITVQGRFARPSLRPDL